MLTKYNISLTVRYYGVVSLLPRKSHYRKPLLSRSVVYRHPTIGSYQRSNQKQLKMTEAVNQRRTNNNLVNDQQDTEN
jgi:hypothetical protein